MALSGRLAGRTSTLLKCRTTICPSTRAFTTARSSTKVLATRQPFQSVKKVQCVRLFSSSSLRRDQTQTAPSAEAYIQSGVIKTAANPVNVKKVLVIGSGGLSIGQAGEFDYSGLFDPFIFTHNGYC
jgi:carbamoyl-phosphate synthase large subunit